ncbi:hypothetical protein RINTHH_19190 [Richelia intracellularis HH01]|jgi:hypothetical protein|uniref:Uncharacterized protein n=1 Tax=Richelia intracellularis HH01 TaxID=1165094 RepID=M1WTF7_9NOST|nr:hypothetical protein RINTHH_19190 [Richelia intracellularis HH01]
MKPLFISVNFSELVIGLYYPLTHCQTLIMINFAKNFNNIQLLAKKKLGFLITLKM